MGCALGARTPHELLRIIVRLDNSKGHLIRNKKTGPGWISYSRMGAFFPKICTSMYLTTPDSIIFRWISACLSCCSFSYQVSVFNYIYLWIADPNYPLYILDVLMFRFDTLDTAGNESIAVRCPKLRLRVLGVSSILKA